MTQDHRTQVSVDWGSCLVQVSTENTVSTNAVKSAKDKELIALGQEPSYAASNAKASTKDYEFKMNLPGKWSDLQNKVITLQEFADWKEAALVGTKHTQRLIKFYESIRQYQQLMNGDVSIKRNCHQMS